MDGSADYWFDRGRRRRAGPQHQPMIRSRKDRNESRADSRDPERSSGTDGLRPAGPSEGGHDPSLSQLPHLQRTYGNQAVQRLAGDGVCRAVYPKTQSERLRDPPDGRGATKAMARSTASGRLDSHLSARVEDRFGTDVSGVRLHTGRAAHEAAEALDARAFTVGRDIFFGRGEYDPTSASGRELLAHEVSHVVQQTRGRVGPATRTREVSVNDDPRLEREADAMGASMVTRPNSPPLLGPTEDEVRRRPSDIDVPDGTTDALGSEAAAQPKSRASVGVFTGPVQRLTGPETAPEQTRTDTSAPVFDDFRGKDVNKIGHVSAPGGQYEIAMSTGVNVRAKPDGTLPPIAKVLYDTQVRVRALDNTAAFYFITTTSGTVGWINRDFVALDPPDPGARLHHITESNLTTILENEYVERNLWTLETGNDYTTLAAAVVVANEERGGVYVDWKKAEEYRSENTLKRWFDPWMIDNFAIYHASVIRRGHNIWLPSPDYVRTLQRSGVIGSRPGWVNAAVDVGKGIAGYYAGVVSGVFGSLWDTLTGLWELGEGIVSTLKGALDGSLFTAIGETYEKITGMTWQDFETIVGEVITMGKNAYSDFEGKWTHPDTYKRWHFRGYVIGAIALEVVLAVFTGGAALGAKVLAKVGKYFPKLMRVLSTLLDVADDLPGRRRRDKRRSDADEGNSDREKTKEDRGWEQALALARIVTEEHDLKDTPVAELIPLLNSTIAAKSTAVRRYEAEPKGTPGTYQIIQRKKKRYVDKHYTELKKGEIGFFRGLSGQSAQRVWDRAKELGWKLVPGQRTGRGWTIVDQNGIERVRYRKVKRPKKVTRRTELDPDSEGRKRYQDIPKYLHEETGYVRWTNRDGTLLDINGNPITAGGTPVTPDTKVSRIRTLVGGDEAEVERIMKASHISVDLLMGDWSSRPK